MTKQTNYLHVYMNDLLIGELTKESTGNLSFCYDKSWLNQPGARPISLSLPLLDKKYTGSIVQNFFDNLLPDNPKIKARIQTILEAPSTMPFDLLAVIGMDCIGAIQLTNKKQDSVKSIHSKALSDKAIASLLKHYATTPLGMTKEQTEFRISLAGAQEKTSLLHFKNKWNLPLNSTPSSHIFKLPIGFIEHQNIDLSDSCENEWLCIKLTKAFGIPVTEASICNFDEVKALVVERFDRKWANDKSWLMRLPQEDCCQALGYSPNLKYELDGGPGIKDVMKLLLGSQHANTDRETFFRSQILFYLLAAIDGHVKNFSLFLLPKGNYCLAPLYDIMSAYPLIAKKQLHQRKIKMAMGLISKNKHYHWHEIQRRHFTSTAKSINFSVDRANELLDQMLSQVDSVIDSVTSILPNDFPKIISDSIFQGMIKAKNRLKGGSPYIL